MTIEEAREAYPAMKTWTNKQVQDFVNRANAIADVYLDAAVEEVKK